MGRRHRAAGLTLVVMAVGLAGCGPVVPSAAPAHRRSRDPETATALLRIATRFNIDYATARYAAVYGRFDAASRAVISRRDYLRRHRECPSPKEGKVATTSVTRGPGRAWLVHYSIGGARLTDTWYYAGGRFAFDLPRSNPSAVALYRSSPSAYARAVGCGR